jgi:hypothetical protein
MQIAFHVCKWENSNVVWLKVLPWISAVTGSFRAVAVFCTAAGGIAENLLQGEQGSEVPAFHVFVVIGFDSLWFLFGGCCDCYGRCWYSMILEPVITRTIQLTINQYGGAVCCAVS